MDHDQFYPTPKSLGAKMWRKFRHSYRGTDAFILEPQAGNGDLIKAMPENWRFSKERPVDVCEIDSERLEVLQAMKQVNIVGHDFLSFTPGKLYTHIIMNPPFRLGAKHLLHAWHIIKNGEITCLLNAETIRQPVTHNRKLVCKLIEEYGEVEYAQDTFLSPDTKRTTSVEVAIVYLKKETELPTGYLDGLKLDARHFEFVGMNAECTELVVPDNVITRAVKVYDVACEVLYRKTESNAVLSAEYAKWSSILGGSLLETDHERTQREMENRRYREYANKGSGSDLNSCVNINPEFHLVDEQSNHRVVHQFVF